MGFGNPAASTGNILNTQLFRFDAAAYATDDSLAADIAAEGPIDLPNPLKVTKAKPPKAPDSKQADILAMLKRRKGATIAEMEAATGWKAKSVRGLLSGTIRKKLGLTLAVEADDKRGRVYRIA